MDSGSVGPAEFRLLGPLEALCGHRRIDVGPGKQRALLALLLLRINRVVPRASLISELWGDTPPESAPASLHTLVSRTRRVLAAVVDGEKALLLRARDPGYVLEGDPEWVDVHRFERLVARGRECLDAGEHAAAMRLLRGALDLWRGTALADTLDAEGTRAAATRLDEERLAALEDLVEAELGDGRPADAIALLEPHVTAHPFRERAWGQLMRALYREGRQSDALAAYRRARTVMVAQLGLEPTPALRRLEGQILHQSPELESERGDAASRPSSRAGRPPDDTVAFLFTDIEASTRRWEGEREAMARDLARHDHLLRRHIEEAGGEVFSHRGDGLVAAFPTASAALAAAVAGQRALRDESWASADGLRVRMAVHAGTVECRTGNYFGPTLNRGARLMAAAHGGQVLCSGASADLARDDLPAGVGLLDLGEHALADLTRPERIHQVTAPSLPATFPPLRSRVDTRHNLPRALTPFIGRATELEQLRALAPTAGLLTLTGVGGAGKTRLALKLAGDLVDHFPDGVRLVELGPVRDSALVVPEVCAAVGVPQEPSASASTELEGRLCAHLRGRRTLVLLDNCEHLVESCAALVQTVLRECPEVGIVVTSREVLGLPGEVVFRVPPLSLPPPGAIRPDDLIVSDAATLLCERARTVQPGFAPTPSNASAIAQICRRLDGIPLALELAATRIGVLSAHQVAERLDDQFRLLTGGSRTAVPRHQTLRATMDWSFESLTEAERVLLRRLSVFPASFDLPAVEAVAAIEGCEPLVGQPGFEVLDLLTRLVDKSLVVVQPGERQSRFRLLEPVRQYAAEKLMAALETRPVQRRHRDHFLRLIDHAELGWTPDDAEWLELAETEEDNLRAAVLWSVEQGQAAEAVHLVATLWEYWLWASRSEAVDLLERALAMPAEASIPTRSEAMLGLAAHLIDSERIDAEGSRALVEAALDLAVSLGDARGQVRARYLFGAITHIQGDTATAERLLIEALAGCREGDVTARGWCHYELGNAAIARGDATGARAHLERALEMARRRSTPILEPQVLAVLAPLAALAGDRARATVLAQEALEAASRLRWPMIRTMVVLRAAEAQIIARDPSSASRTLRRLLQMLHEQRTRYHVADALEVTVVIMEEASHLEAAARILATCLGLRSVASEPFGGTHAASPLVRDAAMRVREAIGDAGWLREYEHAQRMSVEDVIAFGILELASVSTE